MSFKKIAIAVLTGVLVLAAPPSGITAETAPKTATMPQSPDELRLVDVATVVAVDKGDMIKLDNGKTYRLDQIRVPVLYDQLASDYLQSSTMGKKVGIYVDTDLKSAPTDHSNNPYVHVLREDGTWVQADMVARGLAWAFGTERSHTLVMPLYKYEIAARKMGIGFWKSQEYAVKTPENIGRYINSFQLYQGVITNIMFGQDEYIFRLDTKNAQGLDQPAPVTLTMKADKYKAILPPGVTPSDVASKWIMALVRVHGWVEKNNSTGSQIPNIAISHYSQMEFLDPVTGHPAKTSFQP